MKATTFFKNIIMIATFSLMPSVLLAMEEPVVILTEIIDPTGDHGDPHRGSTATIYATLQDHTVAFGSEYCGCTVTLLLNNVVVYSDFVGTDGTVTIPESFTGTFELCITVGTQVFSAEIEL